MVDGKGGEGDRLKRGLLAPKGAPPSSSPPWLAAQYWLRWWPLLWRPGPSSTSGPHAAHHLQEGIVHSAFASFHCHRALFSRNYKSCKASLGSKGAAGSVPDPSHPGKGAEMAPTVRVHKRYSPPSTFFMDVIPTRGCIYKRKTLVEGSRLRGGRHGGSHPGQRSVSWG